MRRSLVLLVFLALFSPQRLFARPRVVVEAAHGGSDSGLRAKGGPEKGWNLKFAKALKAALESAGIDAILLREKDETLSAEKRFEGLNTSRAKAALIIHADRESSGVVRGPFFVVQPPQTNLAEVGLPEAGTVPLGRFRQSLRLARGLAARLGVSDRFSPLSESRATAGEKIDPDGRILAAPHQSLRYAALPAVVIEPLFLSHEDDVRKYESEEAIAAFARSVAQAVADIVSSDGVKP